MELENIVKIIVLALINVVGILLGAWVLKSSIREKLNQWFAVMSAAILLWVNFSYLGSFSSDPVFSTFWSRMNGVAVFIFLFSFYYFFVAKFLKVGKRPKLLDGFVLLGTIIFSFLSLFTNIVVERSVGSEIVFGQAILYLNIFAIIVAAVILYYAFTRYSTLSPKERLRVKYFFIGIFTFIAANIVFNTLFPLMLNTTKYQQLGDFSFIFFLGLTAYGIVKHNLMDIRMVVARSVAYASLLFILGTFYAGTIFISQTFLFPEASYSIGQVILQIVLALIMAFSFQPLRRWITRVTDKIFFKNQYDSGELLDSLAHTIGETIILIELVYKTLDLLISEMKVARGIFIILNDSGSIYNTQSTGYKAVPKIIPADIIHLAKGGILVYDELEENSHFKHLLRKYDAAASIPLKTENTTEGVLILGEKQSGDMYSATDLQVFEIIAPELAVAITNAKAYEKIERFNVTLRQEVKKATGELEKKNEQLRELDKAKDEFISMASHQLRTPLTAIKGYLSMLLEGDAGEIRVSQYDFVNEAFQGANRMVGLINDLLNVSRMETGRFFLEPIEVDFDKLITEEIKQLDKQAKEKKLYLKYEKKGKVPKAEADETKIRQVVMNFVDNALYYTTEGGVTVTLEADKKDIVFKVTDTGIGVPKEQQKNLFTKFYRADNARHVRPDGTGLGIYLAKRVMDDHGGEVIFHSTEGKGSTFGFRLPIKTNLKVKRVAAPAPQAANGTPPIGELAAGIGISAETLEATQAGNKNNDVAKTQAENKESLETAAEAKTK